MYLVGAGWRSELIWEGDYSVVEAELQGLLRDAYLSRATAYFDGGQAMEIRRAAEPKLHKSGEQFSLEHEEVLIWG
jgi:hypothetical protein